MNMMMISKWFSDLTPLTQTFYATLFTWGMTCAGAALVFLFNGINKRILNAMLGFAAGIMIAASFWSLLAPAIELSKSYQPDLPEWLPPVTGFLAGGLFLWITDQLMPHLHLGKERQEAEGIKTDLERSILLVLAITLHNIPEGLTVGVAFGALAGSTDLMSLSGAIALAIGIGIQNFPEGAAVSIPLKREGFSSFKSFWYGQLSGIVEPVAGMAGAFAVVSIKPILPYALSFAAGAMIYVVIEEVIPESQTDDQSDLSTIGAMTGFVIMMILDVALG